MASLIIMFSSFWFHLQLYSRGSLIQVCFRYVTELAWFFIGELNSVLFELLENPLLQV